VIVAAGLSPAWQQILVCDEVAIGEVNRAVEAIWGASGKVLNVARAVSSLGADIETVCPLGGRSGEAIREEFAADGIPAAWIATDAPTRVCTTVIDRSSGCVTEYVENAPAITYDEFAEFVATCAANVPRADIAVFTGSLPKVINRPPQVDVWKTLLHEASLGILDVRGAELLEALSARPFLVKPNRGELSLTMGRPLASMTDVMRAMRELNTAGAQWVLVTAGSGDVLLSSRKAAWRFVPPRKSPVNPIGCGDCLAAGIAVAIDEGAEIIDAVRYGIAAAADNLTQLLPARLDQDRVANIAATVEVHAVPK
jgi:1-phosphofructokinase family hexose kinase